MGESNNQGVLVKAMQITAGFAVLVALLWLGRRVVAWLGWPVPPAILGMVLLLVVLACYDRLADTVQTASTPLLKHMMLFFIPAVSGVMEQFQVLKAGWLPFVAASIGGAVLTLLVTALTFQRLLKRREGQA